MRLLQLCCRASRRLIAILPAALAALAARRTARAVRVRFNRDGSLKGEPMVLNNNPNPAFRVAAEASLRALHRGAPYTFLPASQYDTWNDVELDFRPQDMFRSAAASAPKF